MDIIKYIDFFSIKFNFYTNNQPNYQNLFGGIMSFIYIMGCIGIFIIFSYDDLKRLNPITTISEIPDSQSRLVNIKNEKIWIPFRIISGQNQYVDHRGILHILPYFVEGEYNDGVGIDLKYHLLNYKLCNETSMANKPDNYKIDASLNELFCIEQDDIKFGGNLKYNNIKYIEINLYLCKDGINFNSSDPRCSKIEDLLKNKNTTFSFDFYYPIVQFQPRNIKTPMAIIYKNYFYRLSEYSYKIKKLFLQEHILSDDNNFIISNYKNSSCWGLSSLYGDDYYLPYHNDNAIKYNTSRIYSLNIFMDDGLVYYTRTYKKIIVILSNVFPIFRFVLYFIKKFSQHVKMSLTKRKLAGLIFESDETKPKKIFKINLENSNNQQNNKLIIGSNKFNIQIIRNKNLNNNYNGENCLNDINDKKNSNFHINEIINIPKDNNKNEIENNKSNIILNNENVIKILNTKEISSKSKKDNVLSLYEPLKVKEPSKPPNINKKTIKRKKTEYIFPYYYFFLDIIFDKLIKPQKFFCISRTYFTVYNFMCQIYDISTHIILFKQFNSLNNMFREKMYEEKGYCPTKPYNKINISDNKTIEKLNKDLRVKKSILFSNNLL